MAKKSYEIRRNLLGRIKNEMDACYRISLNNAEHCNDESDDWGAVFNLGKVRAYANVCDYIEGLMVELDEERDWGCE